MCTGDDPDERPEWAPALGAGWADARRAFGGEQEFDRPVWLGVFESEGGYEVGCRVHGEVPKGSAVR